MSIYYFQFVLKIKDVHNGDSGRHDSAIRSEHPTMDPYAVSENSKFTSFCNLISTVRRNYPDVLQFMMDNKPMVEVIHNVTFDMHATTNKPDLVHIPRTGTIPSLVPAKPPPKTEYKYQDIGKEENFFHYMLRCGGTSTKSAGLVLSNIVKNHPDAFVKNDVALIHVIELIIFATALSHRFPNILSRMIEKNGKHSVPYFGVKMARFMDICVCGDSRAVEKGPQSNSKLLIEHYVLIGILSDYKDIIMFKANNSLDTEKAFCLKIAGSCRFKSKFMGWYGGLKNTKDPRPDIMAMRDIIPNYIGMELEKKEKKKTTDNKKTSGGGGKS